MNHINTEIILISLLEYNVYKNFKHESVDIHSRGIYIEKNKQNTHINCKTTYRNKALEASTLEPLVNFGSSTY